jgi:hypothetical protein
MAIARSMAATRTPSQTSAARVRRICKAFRAATAADLAAGLGWYAEALSVAQAIDPAHPERAAGVIAALSPQCQWGTNVAWARTVIAAADSGAGTPRVHTTAMRAQAMRIAKGEPALSVLNGPKVRAFYANIIGDTDAVTVDVWATRVATGLTGKDAERAISTPSRYASVANDYRRAAEILGVTPREVQAATWVAARGVKPTDAGFHADAAGRAA